MSEKGLSLQFHIEPTLGRYRMHLCVGDTVQYDAWSHQQHDLKVCNDFTYALISTYRTSSWSIFLLGRIAKLSSEKFRLLSSITYIVLMLVVFVNGSISTWTPATMKTFNLFLHQYVTFVLK